ncbi:MAG TPA: glycosyltransferase family 2 protein [Thermoanaerobaculia bacterium]|nr:glycosyltransferase family 2 protein [Thermoanaerobaculia bacterium]
MDSSSPLRLSIVVPTHDTRDLTLACLASVFRSPVPGMEVLVVDDASRDGTAEAVRQRFPTATVERHETAERFTRAANRGLTRAAGEILLLLNSDTEVEEKGLEGLLAVFAREPELGIAGALLHYPDGSPQWSGGREPTLAWFFALASGLPSLLQRLRFYRRLKPLAAAGPARVDWVTGAAMALRRQVWEAAGPLDEGFRFYVQDLDFCLRARRAGWEVAVRPELRVLHHHGATIGRESGASRRQQHELLWTDLLRWARKQHGERWAARAGLALRVGAALRLAGRRLASPCVTAERREEWREDSKALRRALAALRLPSFP